MTSCCISAGDILDTQVESGRVRQCMKSQLCTKYGGPHASGTAKAQACPPGAQRCSAATGPSPSPAACRASMHRRFSVWYVGTSFVGTSPRPPSSTSTGDLVPGKRQCATRPVGWLLQGRAGPCQAEAQYCMVRYNNNYGLCFRCIPVANQVIAVRYGRGLWRSYGESDLDARPF